ncbi:MAG: aromatic-L-amino-acid decarboxylase [Saprospiraceae bacterium]|jgi:aromatic-L-amino-acid decarboxylase
MLEKIIDLEKIARTLEPDALQRSNWNNKVIDYSDNFLNHLHELNAFNEESEKGSGLLNFPIAESGKSLDTLLAVIKENVDYPALNAASAGHLAYIPGGGIFPSALGDYLADITNNYAGVFFGGPGAVRMENMLVRWMCDLIGYPKTALGNLTSGGSIANLIAVVTARDVKGVKSALVPQSVIYLTEQIHHSIQKAIRIAGLGEAILRYVPVDDRYRMDVEKLREFIAEDKSNGLKPFLLVASAGTTDVGAIDPLNDLADVAEAHNLWYHIDGAYGGFFALTEEIKNAFKGIERSDSFTIDPHKGLFLAYGTGAVLIKNVEALEESHRYEANYMQDAVGDLQEPSPANLSPELTKHFRGLRMWLPLQLFGLEPFRAALSEKIWLCRYFYEEVQKLGFEVGPYPELSVAIYRYVPESGDANTFNAALVDAVRNDGRVFLSSTTINGVFWIRIAVLCFRSHKDIIDTCLNILKEETRKLLESNT